MTDPAISALVQQAMTGDAAAQASLREALAQHEDPRYRLIADWAGRQSQASEQTIDVNAERVEEPPDGAGKNRRLLRKLRSLTAEIKFQREVGDTLAAALGACYLCWGDDRDCEHCHGRGASGWRTPDPELFDEYIAPAINRLRKQHETKQASRTDDEQSYQPIQQIKKEPFHDQL